MTQERTMWGGRRRVVGGMGRVEALQRGVAIAGGLAVVGSGDMRVMFEVCFGAGGEWQEVWRQVR